MGPLTLTTKYTITPESEKAIALGKAAIVTLKNRLPRSTLLEIGDNHSRRLVFLRPTMISKAMDEERPVSCPKSALLG